MPEFGLRPPPKGGRPPARQPGTPTSDVTTTSSNGHHGTSPATSPRADDVSDVANAERLATACGRHFRWVPQWGTYIRWDGRRWAPDTRCQIIEEAKAVARQLVKVAAAIPAEERALLALRLREATAVLRLSRIDAMITLARPLLVVEPDELDRDPLILNVANGIIDLQTGEWSLHQPERLLTKLAPVEHHRDAKCPRWHRFLERILPDPVTREYVARVIGYCLTGRTDEQLLFFLHGAGENGKNTLVDTMALILGDYACTAEPDLLLYRRDAHPTGEADLLGRRLVLCSEADQSRQLNEALVKRHTGDATLKARKMRQDFWEFTPTHKLVLLANHQPSIRGTDHAIWRRMRQIPFEVRITKQERVTGLYRVLADEEGPGILAWAVAACRRYLADGLGETPPAVRDATAKYRAEMDQVGRFLADRCQLDSGAVVSSDHLWWAYREWCAAHGERPRGDHEVAAALKSRGLHNRKHGDKRRWHWFGIRLVD
jgi:putative DNA primase/helicase